MTEQAQPSLFRKIFNEMVKNQSTPHKINNVVMQHQQPELFLQRNPCVINCQDNSSDEDDGTSSATTAQQRRERMRQRRLRRAQFMDYLKLRHRQRSMAEEVEELHRKLASVRNSIADVERALRVHGYNGREVRRLCHVEELERYQQDDMTPDEDEQDADNEVGVNNAYDPEDDNNSTNQSTKDCSENEKMNDDDDDYYGEPYSFCKNAADSVAEKGTESEAGEMKETLVNCVESNIKSEGIIIEEQKQQKVKTKKQTENNIEINDNCKAERNFRIFAVRKTENEDSLEENHSKRIRLM